MGQEAKNTSPRKRKETPPPEQVEKPQDKPRKPIVLPHIPDYTFRREIDEPDEPG